MSKIIDGKTIAEEIKAELKTEVAKLKANGCTPCLAVVQVGDDPASSVYVRNKQKACEFIGIESCTYNLPANTDDITLLNLISSLNNDDNVHGILVQLPLPKHLNEDSILQNINPHKDVDGFNPFNVGFLNLGKPSFLPCTPAGIIQLLKKSQIQIAGKECVIVGRSNIVGKPMAQLMLQENATVTIAHSKTPNLAEITRRADILIVAMGKAQFIGAEYVKAGAVVIDVGIHRTVENKLCGDVKFAEVSAKASHITPVPGGVGPMTIAMLMVNCFLSAKGQSVINQPPLAKTSN